MVHNPCVTIIGLSKLQSYFSILEQLSLNNNLPIISVGSGTGYYENLYLKDRVICIDPNPNSFQQGKVEKNDYKTVDECLSLHPEYINNCILILIWPSIEGKRFQYNDVPYDWDAIQKLKPNVTFTATDLSMCSGSEKFHFFLHLVKNEKVSFMKLAKIDSFSDGYYEPAYILLMETELFEKNKHLINHTQEDFAARVNQTTTVSQLITERSVFHLYKCFRCQKTYKTQNQHFGHIHLCNQCRKHKKVVTFFKKNKK